MLRNLILEPGAEGLAVGATPEGPWVWWESHPALPGRVGVTDSEFHEGLKSFYIETRVGAVPDEQTGGFHQWVETVPGVVYEFRCRCYSASSQVTGADTGLRIEIHNQQMDFGGPFEIINIAHPTLTWYGVNWYEVRKTFQAKQTLTGIRVRGSANNWGFGVGAVDWYVDSFDLPGTEDPVILGGNVTFGDLLDNVAYDAADFSSEYRVAARRWLNLVRAYIAREAFWRGSIDAEALININGTADDGVYALETNDSPTKKYAFVAGDRIYDVTNNKILRYKDRQQLQSADPDFNHLSNPDFFCDYGQNAEGTPQIMLWGRPTGALDLRGPLYRQYASLTEQHDGLTVDPFFGVIDDFSYAFAEGLRYHMEQNDGEQGANAQWLRFTNIVKKLQKKNGITFAQSKRLRNLSPSKFLPINVMAADPAHYDNPEI